MSPLGPASNPPPRSAFFAGLQVRRGRHQLRVLARQGQHGLRGGRHWAAGRHAGAGALGCTARLHAFMGFLGVARTWFWRPAVVAACSGVLLYSRVLDDTCSGGAANV